MLDLRDSENSNWIKNVGQQDEGEEIDKSSPLLTLQDWLDKQSHNDLRPMNPPSRPPHKGAVWNPKTHRWSKVGEVDLGKQQRMKRGWHNHEGQMPPHPGNVKDHEAYFEEQKEKVGDTSEEIVEPDEEKDAEGESDVDREKKKAQEAVGQPKGKIAQKLGKFNDKVEKILKTLDDLFGGRVDAPQQTIDDLEKLKGEVDKEIEDSNTKIDENEENIRTLYENDKIDDDTKERADKELEELRQYYKEQENELNEKWDENYEKLKEKLSLEEEEAVGDEEEEELDEEQLESDEEPEEEEKPPETEDEPDEEKQPEPDEQPDEEKPTSDEEDEEEEDDIFARARQQEEEDAEEDDEEDDEEDPQWEAAAKNSEEHDAATSAGWGGEEHDEEDFHPETGELQVPGKNANDVRAWTKKLEEKYGIDLIGGPTGNEPHDDIYKHFGFEGGHMGGNPITANHVAAYVHSKTDEYDRPSFNKDQRRAFDRANAPDDFVEPPSGIPKKTPIEAPSGKEDQPEAEEAKPEEPTTGTSNAQTLVDRTTTKTTELKDTKKEIEERQKSLESELEGVGDDDESKKEITDQLANAKNRIDVINTSIQSQTRKTEMANALLNKKPSLNGEEKPVEEKPVGEGFFEGWGFDDKPEGKPEEKPDDKEPKEPEKTPDERAKIDSDRRVDAVIAELTKPEEPKESKVSKVRRRLGIMRDKDMLDDEDFEGMSDLLDIKDDVKAEMYETTKERVKKMVGNGWSYAEVSEILKNPPMTIKELQAKWDSRPRNVDYSNRPPIPYNRSGEERIKREQEEERIKQESEAGG